MGCWLALLWCCVCSGLPLHAQSPPEPQVKYQVVMASATGGGTYVYVPGRWGMLHMRLVNPHEREIVVECLTAFEDEKTLQYGRRVWLPPRARIDTWHPIQVPAQIPADRAQLDFRTTVMEVTAEGASGLIQDDSGKMQLTGTVRLATSRAVTGVVSPLAPVGDEAPLDDRETSAAMSLISASRAVEQLPVGTTGIGDRLLPASEEGLAALDQLVLLDDRSLDDAAGLAAIRRWLFAGGKVWIALDQVDPLLVEALLGDAGACEVVDRVGLTTVRLHNAVRNNPEGDLTREFEEPVPFVRAMFDGFDVAYTVNGWPAAAWKNYGEGRVLVTTLGARAWMRPRTDRDPVPAGLSAAPTANLPVEPMTALSTEFFAARPATLLPADTLEPVVREFIGYEIPARGLIIGLLVGFGLFLVVAAVVLQRQNRLEWLGLLGPVGAFITSGVLVLIGQQHLQAVPPTLAAIQSVEPISGSNDLRIRGTGGLFLPTSNAESLGGQQGGWLKPDMSGQTGTVRRLVWSDLDQWRWEDVPSVVGLRGLEFTQTSAVVPRIAATVTFTPQGLSGQLQLPENLTPEDGVLVTRYGRLGVNWGAAGEFTAPATGVFSREQFLSAGLLSDQQAQRSRLLQTLLTQSGRFDYPDQPSLLFWTAPWDMGFDVPASPTQRGAALVRLPIEIQRPVAGTTVAIPSPFLPFRPTIGPDGSQPSVLYNPRTREFQEVAAETVTWLRFQLPPELLPATPTVGVMTIQVSGPVGKLEVAGFEKGAVKPLKTWTSPVGTLTVDLPQPDLPIDADGGVVLRIKAGIFRELASDLESANQMATENVTYWRIEDLRLSLQAHIDTAHSTAPGAEQ